jgi:hypothetical protein
VDTDSPEYKKVYAEGWEYEWAKLEKEMRIAAKGAEYMDALRQAMKDPGFLDCRSVTLTLPDHKDSL